MPSPLEIAGFVLGVIALVPLICSLINRRLPRARIVVLDRTLKGAYRVLERAEKDSGIRAGLRRQGISFEDELAR